MHVRTVVFLEMSCREKLVARMASRVSFCRTMDYERTVDAGTKQINGPIRPSRVVNTCRALRLLLTQPSMRESEG